MTSDRPSTWFEDHDVLVAEIRKGNRTGAPVPALRGYDNFRELARGGQGMVYAATQRSTRRAVAVKVLLDGVLSSEGARRRFEREIDLVAGLKHPNIVAVYDSGTTEDGRLYLVMELIEGVPLDQALRPPQGPAPVRDVLKVFIEVCDAIHYAHQRGVIHRDLKPSNIRVDRAGRPKVLDFGLAKAAGLDSAMTIAPGGASVLSVSGQFLGSLPWASPEQAGGNPDAVDLRTDVYSLGVILYQVLTGAFPYDVSGSLRVTLDHITNAAPGSPRLLRPEIDDEVATIVGKALAKEPARRYQSAGELGEDLRRYLAGEPIAAKRDSAWYTVRKTLRRYRIIAGAATITMIAIIAGSVVALQQAQRASRERDAAQRERDTAQKLLTRSDATVIFLKNLLGSASPSTPGGGKNARVIDVLDLASAQLDTNYGADKEALASMHQALADTYTKLDLGEQALAHAKAAYEIYKAIDGSGAENANTIAAHGTMGSCYVAMGQWDEGARILEIVAKEHAALAEPRPMDVLSTYSDLGYCYRHMGRFKDAEAAFKKAWSVLPESQRDSDSAIALGNNNATLMSVMGNLPESERLYRRVIESLERRKMGEQQDGIIIASNLGLVLINEGKYQEALDVMEPKSAAAARIFEPDHISALIFASNLATAHQRLKQYDQAESIMRSAIEAREKKVGPDDPELLTTRSNLYTVLMDQKKFEEAAKVISDVVERAKRVRGVHQEGTLVSMNNYAIVLDRLGRYPEAEAVMREVVEYSRPGGGAFAEQSWEPAVFQNVLANVLIKEHKFEEAEKILDGVIEVLRARLGETNPNLLYAYSCKVTLYKTWDKPQELTAAQAIYDKVKADAEAKKQKK
jgi:serine/threonine protein kinase/Flp pilus assembly protein TadD